MRRQGNLGIHTECILTEVGVQVLDHGMVEQVRRSGRKGGVGKLEMKALNVRLKRWVLLREAPGDPWNSVSRSVTSHFLERSFWKPMRKIIGGARE